MNGMKEIIERRKVLEEAHKVRGMLREILRDSFTFGGHDLAEEAQGALNVLDNWIFKRSKELVEMVLKLP